MDRRGTKMPVASPTQYVEERKVTFSEMSAKVYSQIWEALVKISSSMKPMSVAGME